mgnify:FL=1
MITRLMLMCVYLFSCRTLGGAQVPARLLVAVRALDDHVALHSVGDAQNTIEFGNVSGIGVEIDESVVTIGSIR